MIYFSCKETDRPGASNTRAALTTIEEEDLRYGFRQTTTWEFTLDPARIAFLGLEENHPTKGRSLQPGCGLLQCEDRDMQIVTSCFFSKLTRSLRACRSPGGRRKDTASCRPSGSFALATGFGQ